jgi:hypothetical protein
MGRVHASTVTPPATEIDASLSVEEFTGEIDCGNGG